MLEKMDLKNYGVTPILTFKNGFDKWEMLRKFDEIIQELYEDYEDDVQYLDIGIKKVGDEVVMSIAKYDEIDDYRQNDRSWDCEFVYFEYLNIIDAIEDVLNE